MNRKKVFLSVMIVASFMLLLLSVLAFINRTHEFRKIDPLELEEMEREELIQLIYSRQEKGGPQFFYFIPIFGFFGLAVGALVYYVMNSDLEKKDEMIEYNSGILLKLLSPDERKVIRRLAESNGKLQQQEITYMDGFTKVKAHRVIESLEVKGLVEKQKLGKTRLIRMKKGFMQLLQK